MGPEPESSIASSEPPSQPTTAPPTASPSLANTAAAASPTPAHYKKVDNGDSKRTKKILLIVCFKLLCLIVCIISIAVGASQMTDSTAYKASMDDKELCLKQLCNDVFTSPACQPGFFSGKYLRDPGWIKKFEAFKGISIFAVVLGFLILSIYGCWYAGSGCNKAWPVDLVFQLIIGVIVGAGGIVLMLSILDITGQGRRSFATECETRYHEWPGPDEPLDKGNSTSLAPEDQPPTDAEIKQMTNFAGVMAAAVLAILDAILFVTCAFLIAFLTPKEPPPESPQGTQQVVIIEQPPPPPLQPASQPVTMMYQEPPPMMYQQQPLPSGPVYYPQQQPIAYY